MFSLCLTAATRFYDGANCTSGSLLNLIDSRFNGVVRKPRYPKETDHDVLPLAKAMSDCACLAATHKGRQQQVFHHMVFCPLPKCKEHQV